MDGSSAITTPDEPRGCWSYIPGCVNGFSLSLWLKYTVYPPNCDDYGIVSSLHSVEAGGFFLASYTCGGTEMSSGIVDHINGKYMSINNPAPPLSTWTHYVFVIDYVINGDPILKMYQNGIFLGLQSKAFWPAGDRVPTNDPKNVLIFGSRYADVEENLHTAADIDEVLLFDYILEQADVTLIFNA